MFCLNILSVQGELLLLQLLLFINIAITLTVIREHPKSQSARESFPSSISKLARDSRRENLPKMKFLIFFSSEKLSRFFSHDLYSSE